MKFYKDSSDNYWLDHNTLPAGTYILDVNDDKTIVSVYPYDRDTKKLLPTVYNVEVTYFEDESGTPYTDFNAFYTALSGFFAKASGDGGGSTGVLSVTGNIVDNADSLNPVVTGVEEAPNDGSVYSRQSESWVIDESVRIPEYTTAERNAIIDWSIADRIYNTTTGETQTWNGTGWICDGRAHVGTGTLDTIVVSSDPANPSFVTGFLDTGSNKGVELHDEATGTFINNLGRDITGMVGTISFHPTETGAGVGELQVISERSSDGGTTWTVNSTSLRTIEIPTNGESFATKVSSIANLLDGEMFRFRLLEVGSGGVTIQTVSSTILGQTVVSPSATFELTEQGTIDIP